MALYLVIMLGPTLGLSGLPGIEHGFTLCMKCALPTVISIYTHVLNLKITQKWGTRNSWPMAKMEKFSTEVDGDM